MGGSDEDEKEPLECRFYQTEAGTEPVREWLLEQDAEVRKQIGSDIQKVQFRWPVSKPLVDGLGGGLYEVRSTHNKKEFRVLFIVVEGAMVLLHGFPKKTLKTPKRELDVARRRQREVES